MASAEETSLVRRIRWWLSLFMGGLVLSGITVFPLRSETRWLTSMLPEWGLSQSVLAIWLLRVRDGLAYTYSQYPFVGYGFDWLAFAHFVIAFAFVGPWRDPVKNKWVLQFGVFACVGVLPLALITGPAREVPFFWRCVDCSFGVFGLIPLLVCLQAVKRLETAQLHHHSPLS